MVLECLFIEVIPSQHLIHTFLQQWMQIGVTILALGFLLGWLWLPIRLLTLFVKTIFHRQHCLHQPTPEDYEDPY